ncbi:MAG: dephospho-CoA kinase [Clostridia bacterium]|nr:dephospho-CoA kinase [Clostridia bacterium]
MENSEKVIPAGKCRVIGLTGGIGTGKSTVSRYLSEKGCKIVDADKIAHELTAEGSPLLPVLAENFGQDVLCNDGTLDRKKLASIVFSDKEKKKRLDEIMHGRIRMIVEQKIEAYAGEGEKTVILDVPLLFETGMDNLCESVIVVDADEEVRIGRVVERDNTSAELVKARIRNQMSSEEKRRRADFVIDNSYGLSQLYENIDAVIKLF